MTLIAANDRSGSVAAPTDSETGIEYGEKGITETEKRANSF